MIEPANGAFDNDSNIHVPKRMINYVTKYGLC